MRSWILAARPKTLVAGVVPVAAGGVLAVALGGSSDWGLLGIALASCLCLQIATNLFNDAIDFEKGADTEERVGPIRVTQSGLLSARTVLITGAVFLAVATLLSVPLIQARGWAIALIGLPSLYLCFGYTGGPYPLAYLGLGEIFVILFFGLIAVAGSAFVACGEWLMPESMVLGFQVGLLSSTLIAINNLRDIDGDAKVGKRTLAVRRGPAFARREIAFFLGFPYLLGLFWLSDWRPLACALPCLAIPLMMFLIRRIGTENPGPRFNRYLALSSLHMLLFGALWSVGMFFGTRQPSP